MSASCPLLRHMPADADPKSGLQFVLQTLVGVSTSWDLVQVQNLICESVVGSRFCILAWTCGRVLLVLGAHSLSRKDLMFPPNVF